MVLIFGILKLHFKMFVVSHILTKHYFDLWSDSLYNIQSYRFQRLRYNIILLFKYILFNYCDTITETVKNEENEFIKPHSYNILNVNCLISLINSTAIIFGLRLTLTSYRLLCNKMLWELTHKYINYTNCVRTYTKLAIQSTICILLIMKISMLYDNFEIC